MFYLIVHGIKEFPAMIAIMWYAYMYTHMCVCVCVDIHVHMCAVLWDNMRKYLVAKSTDTRAHKQIE